SYEGARARSSTRRQRGGCGLNEDENHDVVAGIVASCLIAWLGAAREVRNRRARQGPAHPKKGERFESARCRACDPNPA
ncbi:MAG: hypothetical protein AB7G40_14180, partial [Hyphomonadaceae bacterium]